MPDNASTGTRSSTRTARERPIVVVPVSPWRHRRRVRLRVIVGTVADVLMVLMFSCLVAFAVWVLEEEQHQTHGPGVSGAHAGSTRDLP
jgi:hypothetical protein